MFSTQDGLLFLLLWPSAGNTLVNFLEYFYLLTPCFDCSLGGVILDYTVSVYKGIAVFQPVINGVGGNLVAVQASRLSTWLHQRSQLGEGLPEETGGRVCISPASVFCSSGIHAKTARVLLLLVILQITSPILKDRQF